MSGWIKIEKALIDTIKFRRVVRAVSKSNALRGVTDSTESFGVAIVLGALVRLWVYADTHIADDDTLAITLDEIDDLVGVQGFAQALPAEWLQVVDTDHVKLPDFLEHNGSSEKLRRDNARRQAAYRHRHKQHNVTRDVTPSNRRDDARPDQTRPEETRPEKMYERAPENVPRETLSRDFEDVALTGYPDCSGRKHWTTALHNAGIIVASGKATEADLRRRLAGYRAFVDSGGVSGPQFVMTPQKWFEPFGEDLPWQREWGALKSKAEIQQDENLSAGAKWLAQGVA
jgi:hypothetical protein